MKIEAAEFRDILRSNERRIERLVNRNMAMLQAYKKLREAFDDFQMAIFPAPDQEPVEVNEQSR